MGEKDPAADSFLQSQLQLIPNLVAASNIIWKNDLASEEKGLFSNNVGSHGYVNFVAEDKSTIRFFSPFEKTKNHLYSSFSASLLR